MKEVHLLLMIRRSYNVSVYVEHLDRALKYILSYKANYNFKTEL